MAERTGPVWYEIRVRVLAEIEALGLELLELRRTRD